MIATEYVVLTESPVMHLVVIRYGDEPWLKVVAAFRDRDRADSYAEVENQFVTDDGCGVSWPDDATTAAPSLPSPPSALTTVVERLKGVESITLAPPASEAPAAPVPLASEPPVVAPEPRERVTTPAERIVAEMWPDLSVSVGEIARRAGVSGPTVYNIRRRLGLPDRGTLALAEQNASTEPEEQEEQIAAPEPDEALPAPVEQEEQEEPDETEDEPGFVRADGEAISAHGVTVVMTLGDECIAKDNKSMDLSRSGARLLSALLKVAPLPVGLPTIIPKVYPGVRFLEAEQNMAVLVRDLAKGLPAIGLELKDIKNVGLALGGVA